MKFLTIAFLLLVSIFCAGRQNLQAQQQGSSMESFLDFKQEDFNGRFAVMALSEENYDYYVTDFSKFKSRFEKIYFLNLSYKDNRLVNIDPDIEKDQMWFKAYFQFQENEIICLFEDFLKETTAVNSSWTDAEKQAWLIQFDKYNKIDSDDE